MNARKLSAWLVAGIPFFYAACGGDNLTLPSEGEPAHIAVLRGSGQSGRVQTQLDDSLVVKVTDTQNRPVANATVQFAFDDAAGGTVAPGSATTNANGEASSSITLGTRVGQMSGHATVPVPEGTVPVTAAFMAIATSADANGIAAVSGQGQNGRVGTTLPDPLVVQVTDNFGNPIPDVSVEWSVSGGGSVSQASTQTDLNGQASVVRTLGSAAGEQTTVATAPGLAGSPVTFVHQATAGNASRVVIVSGNNQEAAPSTQLDDPLVVQVLDANDNPIVNADVTWVVGTGDGSVSPQTNRTDANGRSSVLWTLGAEPGPNVVNAVVSGVGVARFNATGTRARSTTRITAFNPEESIVGQRVAVTVSVTGSGGTPGGSVTVNGESVAQACTMTLSNGTGSCEIAFTAAGNHEVTATYAGDSRFQGSSDDDNYQVRGPNSPPAAAFNPPSCVAGDPCQFTDGSSDSDGDVVGWTWEFGDGQGSNQENPQNLYALPGSYNVKLTVRDNDGATSEVTHQVAVTAPVVNSPPTAFFNDPGCQVNMLCQFTDGSSDADGQVVSWNWNFGDGSGNEVDIRQNPDHTFVGAETFRVTLFVIDDKGAISEVFARDITVAP